MIKEIVLAVAVLASPLMAHEDHAEGLSKTAAPKAVKMHKMSKKTKAAKKAAVKEHWVCPMHDGGESDHAGKCPKCGMDLVLEVKK